MPLLSLLNQAQVCVLRVGLEFGSAVEEHEYGTLHGMIFMDSFEEKLNKIHMEKKEQEVTARNAQAHQEKIGSLAVGGGSLSTNNVVEEADSTEDGEVIDSASEEISGSASGNPNSKTEKEESSIVSSEVTEPELGDAEVQTPNVIAAEASTRKKTRKFRAVVKTEEAVPTSSRRTLRSRKR